MVHKAVVTLFHPHWRNNFRPKVLHPVAYIYWVVLCFAVAGIVSVGGRLNSGLGSVLGFASSITPTQVLEQTNAQRTSRGLPALRMNESLNKAAQAKAAHMFANQYWAHNAPDGTQPWSFIRSQGYKYKIAGENLARDFSGTNDMVNAWMASPSHKENILGSAYSEVGLAVVDGVLLGHETTLVVQMFGTPASVAVQPSTTTLAAKTTAPKTGTTSPAEVLSSPQPTTTPLPVQVIQEDDVLALETQPETELAAAPQTSAQPAVLASIFVPLGSLERPPLFSPLHVLKAFFIALTLFIGSVLVYDLVVSTHQGTVRLVGKNTAHILVLLAVLFLVLFFQGGVVG